MYYNGIFILNHSSLGNQYKDSQTLLLSLWEQETNLPDEKHPPRAEKKKDILITRDRDFSKESYKNKNKTKKKAKETNLVCTHTVLLIYYLNLNPAQKALLMLKLPTLVLFILSIPHKLVSV